MVEVRKIFSKGNCICSEKICRGCLLRTGLMSCTQQCPVRNVQNTGMREIPEMCVYILYYPTFSISCTQYFMSKEIFILFLD